MVGRPTLFAKRGGYKESGVGDHPLPTPVGMREFTGCDVATATVGTTRNHIA